MVAQIRGKEEAMIHLPLRLLAMPLQKYSCSCCSSFTTFSFVDTDNGLSPRMVADCDVSMSSSPEICSVGAFVSKGDVCWGSAA
jgi:hypothetical protein